jgi:hypothetical protein
MIGCRASYREAEEALTDLMIGCDKDHPFLLDLGGIRRCTWIALPDRKASAPRGVRKQILSVQGIRLKSFQH